MNKPLSTSKMLGLIFFALLSFHFQLVGQSASDTYSIRFEGPESNIVHVTADLSLEDDLLKMSSFGPMPDRWSHYIKNLQATDEKGNAIQIEKQDAQWRVLNATPGSRVSISYELHVDHENEAWPGGTDGVAFQRPWGIMLSGRSLFVMNGEQKENIRVAVQLPDTWKVSVPWKQPDAGQDAFIVKNQLQLQESLLFAGTHKEVVIPRGDFSLKFVLGGEDILKQEDQYTATAQKVLDYYIQLMGGNPIPAPGNDLSTALVMIHQSENLDGEVIGNHLSMFINPNADMQNQMIGWFMFVHEFFHLWNGKSLRFQDTATDWFKEGVSGYYNLKALNQVGMVNEEVSNMIMNNLFYQRYVNDSGYGTMAPSEAASGFDKDNHWGLVYGGGFFAGICLDMEIRKNTGNKSSLDNVMRRLYKDFGGKDALIDQNTLMEYISDQAKSNFNAFRHNHIEGILPMPLADYLPYAGIEVNQENGQLQLTHKAEKTALEQEICAGFLGVN